MKEFSEELRNKGIKVVTLGLESSAYYFPEVKTVFINRDIIKNGGINDDIKNSIRRTIETIG